MSLCYCLCYLNLHQRLLGKDKNLSRKSSKSDETTRMKMKNNRLFQASPNKLIINGKSRWQNTMYPSKSVVMKLRFTFNWNMERNWLIKYLPRLMLCSPPSWVSHDQCLHKLAKKTALNLGWQLAMMFQRWVLVRTLWPSNSSLFSILFFSHFFAAYLSKQISCAFSSSRKKMCAIQAKEREVQALVYKFVVFLLLRLPSTIRTTAKWLNLLPWTV